MKINAKSASNFAWILFLVVYFLIRYSGESTRRITYSEVALIESITRPLYHRTSLSKGLSITEPLNPKTLAQRRFNWKRLSAIVIYERKNGIENVLIVIGYEAATAKPKGMWQNQCHTEQCRDRRIHSIAASL